MTKILLLTLITTLSPFSEPNQATSLCNPLFLHLKGVHNNWIKLTWEGPEQAQVQLCPNTTKVSDVSSEWETADKMLFSLEL